MIDRVKETIKNYGMIPPGSSVTVALSGGADSMALLHVLLMLKDELGIRSIEAAHLNHMIRGEEADRDESFVREACVRLGVRLHVRREDVPAAAAQTGESTEECGRRLRYELFAQCGGITATAHNANDNAETLIINLLRGTGLRGLCGIPPVRGSIVRPLIACRRTDIESFCRERGIEYVTDSTNCGDGYMRNRVRHSVIPALEEISPAAVENILLTTRLNRADEGIISGLCREKLRIAAPDGTDGGIDVKMLAAEDGALAARILRYAAAERGLALSSAQTAALADVALSQHGRADIGGGYTASVRGGRLYIENYTAAEPFFLPVDISAGPFEAHGVKIYTAAYGEYFSAKKVNKKLLYCALDCDKIGSSLYLRSRREGDRISLCGRGVTKTLKKLFNEAGIPPKLRDGVPVLADEKGVLWAANFGADRRAAAGEGTRRVLVLEYAGKKYAGTYNSAACT